MDAELNFRRFWFRVTACHVVTYFVAGLLAYTLMDYKSLFQSEAMSQFVRPLTSRWYAAGPGLQVIRGLVLTVVLYPFRKMLIDDRRGWLKLFGLLVGLCVLSTSGAPPGSLEGIIYTRLSLLQHLRGLPEVILQNLAFAVMVFAWCRRPARAWNVVMSVLVALVILFSLAGVFLPRPGTFQ
jgi:hypothetical protein